MARNIYARQTQRKIFDQFSVCGFNWNGWHSSSLPECDCEVHKISWLITDGDNSRLWIDDSAVVIFYPVHAVDDVPLGAVWALGAYNIDLKKFNIKYNFGNTKKNSIILTTAYEKSTLLKGLPNQK